MSGPEQQTPPGIPPPGNPPPDGEQTFGPTQPWGAVSAWFRATFASFGVRNFRLFYLGQGASLTGTWVRRTALGWLVYEMTGSRTLLGTVLGLALVPMFVLSPWAGALADRLDKRRMIIVSQIAAALTSGTIAVLVLAGIAEPWHLMVLATLGGIAFAFEVPARQAFVIEMVGRENLQNAIALNSAMVNLSRIVGPAVAGLLMGSLGIGFCFVADALSYLAVIVTLVKLRIVPVTRTATKEGRWRELAAGFRVVHGNRRVRVLLLLLCLVGVFGWASQTLMPAIAQDLLHLDATQYGLLMSVFGVGAIVGALLVAGSSAEKHTRRQVFGGVWVLCLGAGVVALSRSVVPLGVGLALAGFGAVTFMSTANTLVQTSIDDAVRGRVMGIWSVGFGGALPLGSFLAGWTADVISPYATIGLFAGILGVASFVIWRRLPRPA
jgi:MFS family permease|nr:MFS transporter [Candidatus Krumholzibacteria bacterium]